MERIRIGCVVFIQKENQILLGKRKNIFGTGDWGLPGGHLEYGEKLIDGARREVEEELGVQVDDLELVGIIDDPRDDAHYIHVSFKATEYSGEIQLVEPEKCEEWKFFDLDQLPENIFLGHKNVIKAFQENKLYLY